MSIPGPRQKIYPVVPYYDGTYFLPLSREKDTTLHGAILDTMDGIQSVVV